jgi:hypothetical protein
LDVPPDPEPHARAEVTTKQIEMNWTRVLIMNCSFFNRT